jgi:hypothetical protein
MTSGSGQPRRHPSRRQPFETIGNGSERPVGLIYWLKMTKRLSMSRRRHRVLS